MQLLPSHPANQLLPSQPAYLPSHPANLLTLTLSLLPRNRGTALGIVQSEVQEMQLLPSHPANQLLPSQPAYLPSHPANLLTLTLSLLPRNRGTALGIVQSEVQEMQLLPSHPANQLLPSQPAYLPSHPANLLTLTLSLLPRNRGTALGIVQSEVQEMQLLPSHPANQLLPSQPA